MKLYSYVIVQCIKFSWRLQNLLEFNLLCRPVPRANQRQMRNQERITLCQKHLLGIQAMKLKITWRKRLRQRSARVRRRKVEAVQVHKQNHSGNKIILVKTCHLFKSSFMRVNSKKWKKQKINWIYYFYKGMSKLCEKFDACMSLLFALPINA